MPLRLTAALLAPTILSLLLGCVSRRELSFHVEPAPEWDALVDQNEGWTGSDGIFSIPMNGDERPGAWRETDTMLIFSDTFVGPIHPDGSRPRDIGFVNNSSGYRYAGEPWANDLNLFYKTNEDGRPVSLFTPQTPLAGENQWYWMKDGFLDRDSTVRFFASRFRFDETIIFHRVGLVMISIPPGSEPPYTDHEQRDVPFFREESDGEGTIVFGAAVFPNTKRAHAPDPDGYVYIYGTREVPGTINKRVIVARVPDAEFSNFDAWRFYDGADWVENYRDVAIIADRASNELSVSPTPDGRYIMVFQIDSGGPEVGIRLSDTPWGPWSEIKPIYTCPEPTTLPEGVITYNAKGHPHLSHPGELLISYNVNTLNNEDHFSHGEIYRPRFFRLIFE